MEAEKETSHQLLKSINQQKVLYLIHTEGPISRVELAEKSRLTQQTVTNIVNRLLEQEMVLEGKPLNSTGGRKRVPLTTNGSNLFAVGIEVAGKYVRGSLSSFDQTVLSETIRKVDGYQSEDHFIEALSSVIDELLEQAPDKARIKGGGLSIQGLVDSRQGIVLRLPGLGWGRFSVRERLEEAYGMPFYLENDVNLLALNENMQGHLSSSMNNVTLKFDYGIGGAIVADKELVTGSTFVAGEFGHYKAFSGDEARPCHCGGSGCLTTLASASGLELNEGLSLEEFARRVRSGDGRALRLFEHIVFASTIAISNLVTFLNPDHLLITGSIMEALGDLILPELESGVLANVPKTCRDVKLVHLRQAPDETMLASGLVIKKTFEVPVERLSLR